MKIAIISGTGKPGLDGKLVEWEREAGENRFSVGGSPISEDALRRLLDRGLAFPIDPSAGSDALHDISAADEVAGMRAGGLDAIYGSLAPSAGPARTVGAAARTMRAALPAALAVALVATAAVSAWVHRAAIREAAIDFFFRYIL